MVIELDYIVGVNVKYYYVGEVFDGNLVLFIVYGVFVGLKVMVEYGLKCSFDGVSVVI